jgi:hypothetical protein
MKQDTCISGAYAYGAGDRGNFASREIFVSLSGNIGKNEIFFVVIASPIPPGTMGKSRANLFLPSPYSPPP